MNDIKMVIVVRKDLNMRKGKLAAQVAHAAMEFLRQDYIYEWRDDPDYPNRTLGFSSDQQEWLHGDHTKIVVSVDSEQGLLDLIQAARVNGIICYPITDLGLTEFHGKPTLTCAGFGPHRADVLDQITGHLPLI